MTKDRFDNLSRKDKNKKSVQQFLKCIDMYRKKNVKPFGLLIMETDKRGKTVFTPYDVNVYQEYVFVDGQGNPRSILPPICKTIYNVYNDEDVEHGDMNPKTFRVDKQAALKWLNLFCEGIRIYPETIHNDEVDLSASHVLSEDWKDVNERCGIHPFITDKSQNNKMTSFLNNENACKEVLKKRRGINDSEVDLFHEREFGDS